MRNRHLLIAALCGMLGAAGAAGCSDDGGSNVDFNHFLRVDHPTLNFDTADDDPSLVVVTLVDDNNNPLASQSISATSRKAACAGVDVSSAVTDASGRAQFNISPNALDDCRTTIVFSAEGAQDANVKVQVGDGGDDTFGDGPSISIVNPENKNLTVIGKDATGDFTARYFDNNVNGVKIGFKVEDESCVTLTKGANQMTGADGSVTNTVKALKDACTTKVVVTANNDSKITDTLNVSVTNATEYKIDLSVVLNDTKRYDRVDTLCYDFNVDETVISSANPPESYKERSMELCMPKDQIFNGITPELYHNSQFVVPVGSQTTGLIKSVLFIAKDAQSNVIAYGEEGVNVGMNSLVIDLKTIPYNYIGEYHVVSNFDFTSGFNKTDGEMPVVEKMIAGDWVQFVMNFFEKPIQTLFDFIWVNSLSRLKDVDFGDSTVNSIIQTVLSDFGKTAASNMLTPMLEELLGEKTTWYATLKTVLPDVRDLIGNMQFIGTINTGEKKAGTTNGFTNATLAFSHLLYQWSLGAGEGSKVTCVNDADGSFYVKPGAKSCRVAMDLGETAIKSSANWEGNVKDDPMGIADGLLNIPSVSLDFEWALILYNAVFGNILPNAFKYNDSTMIEKKRYLSAFLEFFLFKPFIEKYNTKRAADSTYPELSSNDSDKRCEQFIEALIFSIKKDVKAGLIVTAGSFVCSDSIMGQLDKALTDQLKKFTVGSAQAITLSAKDCKMYSEDNINYTRFGKPDEDYWPAIDVYGPSAKESVRCQWDIAIPGDNIIKGLFHAKRK